ISPLLDGLIILNSDWITSGIHNIMNYLPLIVESRGVLDTSMLPDILNSHRYPPDKRIFLIELMERYELCFRVDSDPNNSQYLIPSIITEEEPDTGKWSESLAFQYEYSVLPESLISRFIVRTSHLISKQTYWRTGVVLARYGNRARVRSHNSTKLISVEIDGPLHSRRELLTIIRDAFSVIHNTMPGLEVIARVPIPNAPKVAVSHEHLRKLEQRGDKTYLPEGLNNPVNIQELLYGIEPRPCEGEGVSEQGSKVTQNFYGPVYGAAGNVEGDLNINANSKSLAEVAAEIQALLKQLETTNPSATEIQQKNYVDAVGGHSLTQKAKSALKAGWEESIDQFVENRYVKVIIAILKGWQNPED
ncbi:MAG: COR domain-containing protein, partial [Cyanobacteria bacterium J06642_12]